MSNWEKQLQTLCFTHRGVIVYGNVEDTFFEKNSMVGHPITHHIEKMLSGVEDNSGNAFEVVTWNPVTGAIPNSDIARKELEQDIQNSVNNSNAADNQAPSNAYDYGQGSSSGIDIASATKTPESFFQILLSRFTKPSGNNRATAYIVDGADSLFGNANSLSQVERQYLLLLDKALRDAPCEMDTPHLDAHEDIIILITSRQESIPSRFYQENSALVQLHVPNPDRKDRTEFLLNSISSLYSQPIVSANTKEFEELVDNLEGSSYRDMQQIIRLSHIEQNNSVKKLINQYRYGESISPWEDLNQKRVSELRSTLTKRVKGQNHVIDKINKVIINAYTGLSGLQHSGRQQMPKGILFFVGPTGVGKTETAKALAEFLFQEEEACIRFDMSEYNHEHSDQRLIGAPPGYTGYEEGGQLTNAIRRKPFSVILFDEIEKAHGKILDKFLQILEDGRLTDGKGDTVSFGESLIIFTSNIGAADVQPDLTDTRKAFIEKVKEHFTSELERPELLNRIGEQNIIPFNFLTDDSVLIEIVKTKLNPLRDKLAEKYGLKLVFDDEEKVLRQLLVDYDPRNGGRGIANRLKDMIIDPISVELFDNPGPLNGRSVEVTCPDRLIRVRIK